MESAYPEQERRRAMLLAVRGWLEQGNKGKDLYPDTVDTLVENHMDDNISLFHTLVRQGYIDAKLEGRSKAGGPFGYATVYDLTVEGHQLIDTLPDPRQEFLRRLDAIEEAIWALQDPNVSDEQKKEAAKAIEVLRQFGIGVSASGAWSLISSFLQQGYSS